MTLSPKVLPLIEPDTLDLSSHADALRHLITRRPDIWQVLQLKVACPSVLPGVTGCYRCGRRKLESRGTWRAYSDFLMPFSTCPKAIRELKYRSER